MKKQFLFLSATVLIGLSACNDDGKTTDTTTTATNPGDTTIKTTTTTTTTMSVHPIANFEHRTFMNIKTGKPVKLRIDTVNHYYVDVVTNKEPDYYYFDPATHDTFDYMGRVLNNAIMMNNGSYTVDETRLMPQDNMQTPAPETKMTDNKMTDNGKSGNLKIKQTDDKYKKKTDSSKLIIKKK
ncbi:MAG: hypothetical protein H0W12_07305 [Chitinophagaceae bacterium]|nr:hypothetical protein [Chitinophagaceae bacterium]HEV8081837.1 hypothetical protein [Chitinophagaceae bacterium]